MDAPTLKEKERRKSYTYPWNDCNTNASSQNLINYCIYSIFGITTVYILFIVPYCTNEVIFDYLYISEIPIWKIGV